MKSLRSNYYKEKYLLDKTQKYELMTPDLSKIKIESLNSRNTTNYRHS